MHANANAEFYVPCGHGMGKEDLQETGAPWIREGAEYDPWACRGPQLGTSPLTARLVHSHAEDKMHTH